MHELRFAAICGFEPCVHPPRLKIPRGRDRADLAVGVLTGEPGLDVKGPARAKAHVTGAQDHGAVRHAQTFQHVFGTAQHPLLFVVRLIGVGDRYHLDLLELVLAQHARGVAARAAGFGTEAQGVGGHPAGQGGFFQHVTGDRIGERHFGGGDQPPAVGGLIAVVAELGQLVGAIHRLVAHQHGGHMFGQPVFIDMGVDHELRQRTVNPRHGPFKHHKARAGGFGGGFEIH